MKRHISIAIVVFSLGATSFADMAATGKGAEETVGSQADWSIYAITVNQYFKLRNLVRDAYIEVQTWKAIKATWEEQKEWFERNKARWNRITTTLSSLSSDPKDVFSNLKKVEAATNEIDNFIMFEPKKLDNIMQSYEDNASVAWDHVGPYLGSRYVPADQIWKEFNKFCQDHTMRNNPVWQQSVAASGDDPGYVDPIYQLPVWKRRNILGKSFSVITAQADALAMRREEREKYWTRFQQEMSAALVTNADGAVKPDAIQGEDVMRRVQTLADVNDLILSRTMESQAMMTLAGDEVYGLSTELQKTIDPINEQKQVKSILQGQLDKP